MGAIHHTVHGCTAVVMHLSGEGCSRLTQSWGTRQPRPCKNHPPYTLHCCVRRESTAHRASRKRPLRTEKCQFRTGTCQNCGSSYDTYHTGDQSRLYAALIISHTSRRAPLQPVSNAQVPCTPYRPPNIAGVQQPTVHRNPRPRRVVSQRAAVPRHGICLGITQHSPLTSGWRSPGWPGTPPISSGRGQRPPFYVCKGRQKHPPTAQQG
jgi:hypothetical protein